MQDILAWLKSERDFTKGVELYKKFGTNNFFKTLLTAGPTPYNLKKLVAELEVLAPATPAIPQKQVANIKIQEPKAAPIADKSKDIEKYLQLKQTLSRKYDQLKRNMAQLDYEKKQDVLHLTAKQILSLDSQIKEIWMQLDFYDENGTFPVLEPKPEPPKRSTSQSIQLLHQTISKAKARYASGKCRNPEKTLELIKTSQTQLDEMKKELKRG
jgi:hypothetical protein